MADFPILIDGPVAAPARYVLDHGEHLTPTAVSAQWDGSGAAGSFRPCLSFYSPDGLLLSRVFPDDPLAAGDSAEVTYAPFLRRRSSGAAAAASALPWAIAEHADYVAGDFFFGRSPNPLSFRHFTSNDATAYAFVQTDNPTVGDGDVTILRSGLYLVRVVISSRLNGAASDPGYSWDMVVYVQGQDGGGGLFFGPDLFSGGSKVQPVASYATYLSPRDQPGFPNGNSMLGRREQHVETVSYFNLPDAVVTWPVTIQAQFRHGLNDADVTVAPEYILWLTRVGDANDAAPTT